MQILDGKATSKTILQRVSKRADKITASRGHKPHLAVILVGEEGPSLTYVGNKLKMCETYGFDASLIKKTSSVSENEVLEEIEKVNHNSEIDGLIVQLPLPNHISVEKVITTIKPEKDVDGFHPLNVGRMFKNKDSYVPATPFGVIMLLKHYGINAKGKNCVIVGRSQIVGAPMAVLMAADRPYGNATVTLCHRYTENLKEKTSEADILIVATGIPGLIKADMVKEGAVVIDVGITRVPDTNAKKGYVIKGDVEFEEVSEKVSYITPVPGGVGPMTITGLLMNTLASASKAYYD